MDMPYASSWWNVEYARQRLGAYFNLLNRTSEGEKEMEKKYRLPVIGICLVFISTGFVVALSQPFDSPLVVVFGDSKAEDAALAILLDEMPNSLVVQYDSFAYDFFKMKSIGVAILIGHGNEAGIFQNGKLVQAQEIVAEISNTPARRIMITACNSKAIADLDESGRSFGFSHYVDAELAAFETAIRVQIFYNMRDAAWKTFEKFLDVLSTKFSDETSILPLMPIEGGGGGGGGGTPPPTHSLSGSELFNAAMVFALGCVFALVGIAISIATSKLGAAISSRLGSIGSSGGILSKIYNFFITIGPAGIGSLLALVNTLFGGILSLAGAWLTASVDIVASWIAAMDIVEWMIFLGLTGIEVILAILTAGAEPLARLQIGILVAIMNAALIAISDYNDYNDVPCQSVMQAASQLLG